MAAAAYYTLTQALYIAYFGRPADPRGLEAFASALSAAGAPTNLVALHAAYRTNVTVHALVDSFGTSTESNTLYGSADVDLFIDSIFLNVLNRPAKLAGLLFWNAEITSGRVTKGAAALAIAAGAFANTSDPVQAATDQNVILAKIAAAASFTAAVDSADEVISYKGAAAAAIVRAMLHGVTDTTDLAAFQATIAATLQQLTAATTPPSGRVFALTAGLNVVAGTSADDTIDASLSDSLSAFDNIDGGAGSDALVVLTSGTAVAGGVTIKNVEHISISTTGAGFTVDTTAYAGATSLTLKAAAQGAGALVVNGAGAVSVTSTVAALGENGGAISIGAGRAPTGAVVVVEHAAIGAGLAAGAISVTGGSTVSITETATNATALGGANTAATQSAVTVTGTAATTSVTVAQSAAVAAQATTASSAGVAGLANGSVRITDANAASLSAAGSITSVSLDNFGEATVNSGALSSLTLAGTGTSVTQTAGALSTPTATTLNLNLLGVAAGAVVLDEDHTSLTILSSGAMDTVANTLASLTAAGASQVTLNGNKALVLSAQSFAPTAAITSIGHSAVTLKGALLAGQSYAGSVGADTITLAAGVTGAITTGSGDDNVTLTSAALGAGGSVDAGAGTADTLTLSGSLAASASAEGTALASTISNFERLSLTGVGANPVDLARLDNISHVAVDGGAATLTNFLSGGTVVLNAGASALTVVLKDALAGSADVLTVAISAATASTVGTLTASAVETVKFLTDDAAAAATGIAHGVTLVDSAVRSITVAGDAGLNLSIAGASALTSFDASAVSKGTVTLNTGALAAAASIQGGADHNAINFSAATKAVAYTGSAGVDTINAGNGADNTISTGAGADAVALGSGRNIVDLGAGDDTITFGANLNVVTGGAGKDHFTVDNVSNGNTYSTITDFVVGEDLHFGGVSTAGTLGANIVLGATAAFADFLQAAAAGNASQVAWFTYGGDTYVVADNSAETTYSSGTDQVVKLVGTLNLSASSVSASGLVTFLVA